MKKDKFVSPEEKYRPVGKGKTGHAQFTEDQIDPQNGVIKNGRFIPMGPSGLKNLGLPDHLQNHRFSDETKATCVALWLETNNLRDVSRQSGVGYETLKKWKQAEWWHETVANILSEEALSRNKRLKKIADKAAEAVEDRLDKGNYQYNPKTGKLMRVPVSARDASAILENTLNESRNIQKEQEAKGNTLTKDQINDKLDALASAFADKFHIKRNRQPIIVDMEKNENGDFQETSGIPGSSEEDPS